MSIHVITVVAGSEKLVKMTESMLEQFYATSEGVGHEMHVTVINNGAKRAVRKGLYSWQAFTEKNLGFGKAVNLAIKKETHPDDTHVLVLNNDLEFPDEKWLFALLADRDNRRVCSPCTDRTATQAATATKARDREPMRVHQVSAFCWLVPMPIIRSIKKRFRFELFDPEFFAYGEDDLTSAILRRYVAPDPFLVIPRSWVRHLKHKTGAEVGMSGGMPKNLELLKHKMRKMGLR